MLGSRTLGVFLPALLLLPCAALAAPARVGLCPIVRGEGVSVSEGDIDKIVEQRATLWPGIGGTTRLTTACSAGNLRELVEQAKAAQTDRVVLVQVDRDGKGYAVRLRAVDAWTSESKEATLKVSGQRDELASSVASGLCDLVNGERCVGTLRVDGPAHAKVFAGSREIGETPFNGQLPIGPQPIRVALNGKKSEARDVTILYKQETAITAVTQGTQIALKLSDTDPLPDFLPDDLPPVPSEPVAVATPAAAAAPPAAAHVAPQPADPVAAAPVVAPAAPAPTAPIVATVQAAPAAPAPAAPTAIVESSTPGAALVVALPAGFATGAETASAPPPPPIVAPAAPPAPAVAATPAPQVAAVPAVPSAPITPAAPTVVAPPVVAPAPAATTAAVQPEPAAPGTPAAAVAATPAAPAVAAATPTAPATAAAPAPTPGGETTAPSRTVHFAPHSTSWMRPAFLATAGATGVLLVTGIVCGAVANSSANTLNEKFARRTLTVADRSSFDSVHSTATAANVAFGLSAATAISAGVLFALHPQMFGSGGDAPGVSISPQSVSLGGKF